MAQVDGEGIKLDVEATFRYLDDMLHSGGDCDSAIAARCCVAWGKLRKLLPILSPKVCGNWGVHGLCLLGYAPH